MRVDYVESGVRLTDLTLTAALLIKMGNAVTLIGTEHVNGDRGQLYFVLSGDRETIQTHITEFLEGRLVIEDAQSFGEQIRNLKVLVYTVSGKR